MVELKRLATKLLCIWVHWGDFAENSGIEAALEILLAPYSGDTLIPTAKYFTPSFSTEQMFLVVVIVEDRSIVARPKLFFKSIG